MNKTQLKLIELSMRKNIWDMSLREIGKEIDVKNAATVKYHLDQLKKKNLLRKPNTLTLEEFKENLTKSWEALVNIPILGKANCGVPLAVAEENLEGHLRISPKLLPKGSPKNFFALKAEGDSMNQAKIEEGINSGDFVIIDKSKTQPRSGDYVLSIIDGAANIKKIVFEIKSDHVALISESSEEYSPIYIHKDDNFLINGTVVSVIKQPIITS